MTESQRKPASIESGEQLARKVRAISNFGSCPPEMQASLKAVLAEYYLEAPKQAWQVHLRAMGRFVCVIPEIKAYSPAEASATGVELAAGGRLGYEWKYESGQIINMEAFPT